MQQDNDRRRLEKELDEAVRQTFPASDPIAPRHITGTEPPGSDPHRKTPRITREQIEAASRPAEPSTSPAGRAEPDSDEGEDDR
jgi:hypothetical protein